MFHGFRTFCRTIPRCSTVFTLFVGQTSSIVRDLVGGRAPKRRFRTSPANRVSSNCMYCKIFYLCNTVFCTLIPWIYAALFSTCGAYSNAPMAVSSSLEATATLQTAVQDSLGSPPIFPLSNGLSLLPTELRPSTRPNTSTDEHSSSATRLNPRGRVR